MGSEYNYDIIIVGAGPAGLLAAWTAAKNGVSVAVRQLFAIVKDIPKMS